MGSAVLETALVPREAAVSPLSVAVDFVGERRTTAFLVARGEQTLVERYWAGLDADRPAPVTSISKSVVSLLVGIALREGAIASVEQPAAEFLGEWRGKPQERILIRHLLSMTSGLQCPTLWELGTAVPGQFGVNLRPERAPGTHWEYNTGAYRLLFTILERATGEALDAFTRRALAQPLGLSQTRWRTGVAHGTPFFVNLLSSARDLATIGRLVAQGGAWNGQPLVAPGYLDAALRPSQALNPAYGFLFWVNSARKRLQPDAPLDTVGAFGAGDCRLFVIPSRDLVVVRLGGWVGSADERKRRRVDRRNAFDNVLLRLVCGAAADAGAPVGGGT